MNTLPESELRQILEKDLQMKSGHVRKFVNEIQERESEAQYAQG